MVLVDFGLGGGMEKLARADTAMRGESGAQDRVNVDRRVFHLHPLADGAHTVLQAELRFPGACWADDFSDSSAGEPAAQRRVKCSHSRRHETHIVVLGPDGVRHGSRNGTNALCDSLQQLLTLGLV